MNGFHTNSDTNINSKCYINVNHDKFSILKFSIEFEIIDPKIEMKHHV